MKSEEGIRKFSPSFYQDFNTQPRLFKKCLEFVLIELSCDQETQKLQRQTCQSRPED